MSDSSGELFFLAGVTASGKTELAITWAKENDAEILSCDSVAFYKGMDIGSSKPSLDDRQKVCHYGLDLSPVNECFDISRFVEYARMWFLRFMPVGKNFWWWAEVVFIYIPF